MRKGRFSEEQMVAIMREADRDPVAAVAKRHGISEQTIYTWRKRFGGLQASDVKRLRQLEAENGRLGVGVSQPEGREGSALVARMKELSAQYPRYGYRRIRIFLNRDGHRMSPGSGAPAVANGKAASGRGSASPLPRGHARKHRVGRTRCGAYDFVLDHCANGQQLKCLTVADEFTKEGLAIDVDGRSARVIEVLSRLVSARGAPRCLRSDNGPERVQAVVFEEKEVPYNVRYMDKP